MKTLMLQPLFKKDAYWRILILRICNNRVLPLLLQSQKQKTLTKDLNQSKVNNKETKKRQMAWWLYDLHWPHVVHFFYLGLKFMYG